MSSPAIEHNYRYPFASSVTEDGGETPRVQLATSGGTGEWPYFFQGQLCRPRITAQLLRLLSRVVAARYHMPAAMLRRRLQARDPVVTSGGGMLRFEGFSACCSVYGRVDLTPEAYRGVVAGQGTTNVDFNADMRAALARVRDGENVGLAVGTDEVALLRGAEQVVERKVELPVRWLKGFVEVQAFQSRMEPRARLGKTEALRFLRSLPKSVAGATASWAVPAGKGLRWSQRESDAGVKLAGIERLRLLEEIAPFADGLEVYADAGGEASEWQLLFGPLRFCLTLSADVWRGFSGEGQVLSELAAGNGDRILSHVQGSLKWQSEIRLDEFAGNWDLAPGAVQQAFAVLGSRGLVGYDLARGAYFHRELPFDLGLVEEMHPRLKHARQLVSENRVQFPDQSGDVLEAEVRGTEVTHRVRLAENGATCTCAWHAKHQGDRGPCKHILAAQILAEERATG